MKTKIFLDSGDPKQTKEIIGLLGFLDGQTTNPSLIAKNPEANERLEKGDKFSKGEIFAFYKGVVQEVSLLIPRGSVSIEVYADQSTSAHEMLEQAHTMFSWIPNAHIKFPIITEGLKAAKQAVQEGMRVNMTLCFTQAQAAAVYEATKGAKKGDVFISPFVGRLDDKEENGMSLIENILKMYEKGDGHVEVLTASVRNMDHMMAALSFGSDIITAPSAILKEWSQKGTPMPDSNFVYDKKDLKQISYQEITLEKSWREFNISHDLTDAGITRFSDDWNKLISQP